MEQDLVHCRERPMPQRSRGPCLNASGRLPEHLPWDQPTEKTIPLFIRWEDYSDYLPHRNLRGTTFVQIGANCGKNVLSCAMGGDPVWSYATMCDWQDVAVEPHAPTFRQLCRNYAPWPKVTPLRGAVADKPGWKRLKVGWSETNALVDLIPPKREGFWNNVTVPVISISGLWAQRPNPAQRVDILVVDAEGAEPLILAGPEPLPKPWPFLILYEHFHLTRSVQATIDTKLKAHGFHHIVDLKHADAAGRRMPPQNRLYGRK